MLLLTDVYYPASGGARAAGVVLREWTDARPAFEKTVEIAHVQPYVSGQFFRRELPCLMELCQQIHHPITCAVVDAHVWLGKDPGLGECLSRAIGRPVVGIAKNAFEHGGAQEVLRGTSASPLYVSATGLAAADACALVRAMAGPYRMPKMLKRVDRLSRGDT